MGQSEDKFPGTGKLSDYPWEQAAELRSEANIVKLIWNRLPSRPVGKDWLRMGIGDDASVIGGGNFAGNRRRAGRSDWVLSVDQFLEDVHFRTKTHPPETVGYKALARATSDLAAMGAVPRFFMLSLAMPANRTGKWLDLFLRGMAAAAREFKMVVIGGDTSRFPQIVVNLTVGGQTDPGGARKGSPIAVTVLARGGARAGDLIYVSGVLGAAQAGLELMLSGLVRKTRRGLAPRNPDWKPLLEAHMRPKIQIGLGRWLAGENPWKLPIASATIDTSDGLSTDLGHICESSGVGARVWAEKIPTVPFPGKLRKLHVDGLTLAVHGGEDYQLLFTVPARISHYLPKSIQGVPITNIGEIVGLSGRTSRGTRKSQGKSAWKNPIELVDAKGRSRPLRDLGWDPFRIKS